MDIVTRGQAAKQVLEHPLIKETLIELEKAIVAEWLGSPTAEVRDELWYTLKGLQRFETVLTISVSNGEYESTIRSSHE